MMSRSLARTLVSAIFALLAVIPSVSLAQLPAVKSVLLQNAAASAINGTPLTTETFREASVTVTITGVATITWEQSVDGVAWSTGTCVNGSSTTGEKFTTATASGIYHCNIAGLTKFRARISSYTSGTVTALARMTMIPFDEIITTSGLLLRDEGATQGRAQILNCTGAGIACSLVAGVGTIDGSGGGGGGGAPTTVRYWTGAADATLSAEHNLGALGTGLVINTAGTPSILASNTCAANNFGVSINASGVLGCAQPLFSNISGSITDAQVPNNITVDLATLATTASALAANGGNCTGNNFAIGVDAAGVGECAQPAFSNLSGTATTAQIGDDQITYAKIQNVTVTNRLLGRITAGAGDIEELTGTQATTLLDPFTTALKGVAPASGGGTTNFLRADGTWAAPPGGGGGSANVVEVSLSLGASMGLYYSTTVTGQSWVTASSVVACSMFGTTADGQTPETIAVAGIIPTVSDRVNGVGFNLNVLNPNGATGTVRAHCTGA